MVVPSFQTCSEVTAQCPVVATTYGYYPIIWANAALACIFGACLLAQVGLAVFYRTWVFLIALGLGTFGELIGYIGRLQLHHNPWNRSAFILQIVTLVLAPTFFSAAIYLSIRDFIAMYGPQYSKLKPRMYVLIFITADVMCILMQGAGGGIAASAKSGNAAKLQRAGVDIIVVGIALQIVVMMICALFSLDFFFRRGRALRNERKSRTEGTQGRPQTQPVDKLLVGAVSLAFICVEIRCIYRIPEMVGGWGNSLMRNEPEFLGLDGLMIAIAGIAMTVVYPGRYFNTRGRGRGRARAEHA